jgi:hypothetical protein
MLASKVKKQTPKSQFDDLMRRIAKLKPSKPKKNAKRKK